MGPTSSNSTVTRSTSLSIGRPEVAAAANRSLASSRLDQASARNCHKLL